MTGHVGYSPKDPWLEEEAWGGSEQAGDGKDGRVTSSRGGWLRAPRHGPPEAAQVADC